MRNNDWTADRFDAEIWLHDVGERLVVTLALVEA
jgi:hypothetical protein